MNTKHNHFDTSTSKNSTAPKDSVDDSIDNSIGNKRDERDFDGKFGVVIFLLMGLGGLSIFGSMAASGNEVHETIFNYMMLIICVAFAVWMFRFIFED